MTDGGTRPRPRGTDDVAMPRSWRRVAWVTAIAGTVALSSGCQPNGGSSAAVVVTSSRVPTTAPVSTPSTTQSTPSTPATEAPVPVIVDRSTIKRSVIATLQTPVGLAVRPGDPANYLVEQRGTIVRIRPDGSVDTVLDIGAQTKGAGERGLLGLAFHPTEPLAYIYFTDTDGATTIAEFSVGEDGRFDPASERQVWKLDQPYSNHNGGDLQFGPAGMLFAGVGDGGSGGDPERRADDPTTPYGSLIRIDPLGRDSGAYSIPPDNPFGNEVWAYGLRNPWKFSFDAATGDLWIADVGQNRFEEINRVRAPGVGKPAGRGLNFGWSAFEATTRFNRDVAATDDTVPPVLYYEHRDDNCSVSGGATLGSWYLYGDYCSGRLWAFNPAEERNVELGDGFGNISAVRTGADGSVYVLDHAGSVYRLNVDG